MKAKEITCPGCKVAGEEACDTSVEMPMIGSYHRVRVTEAAKVERAKNLARQKGK